MSKHSKKIEQLKAEISDSGLEIQHKAYAVDVLAEVEETTNGTPDKAQAMTDAILAMTSYMIRRDIYLQETHSKQIENITVAIVKGVEDHAMKCPVLADLPRLVTENMKARAVTEAGEGMENPNLPGILGKVAAFVAAVRPALWPVAVMVSVVAFSPYVGPGLLQFFKQIGGMP